MITQRVQWTSTLIALGMISLGAFQNCSHVDFGMPDGASLNQSSSAPTDPISDNCAGTSCSLDPLTKQAAVTTILMALGDEMDHELVVDGASSQLIAETIVRMSTPATNPKILFAWDSSADAETPEDRAFVSGTLLKRYDVTSIIVADKGLRDADVAGFDLVWFTNPGHAMASDLTRATLAKFAGGVILEGDDLAHAAGGGTDADMAALTGLKFSGDNGTSVTCGTKSFAIDNNSGAQYQVGLNTDYFPGEAAATLSIHYGNDIDRADVTDANRVKVLAWAKGPTSDCTDRRPAVVTYLKSL